MSKKSCPFWFSISLHKNGQDFVDKQNGMEELRLSLELIIQSLDLSMSENVSTVLFTNNINFRKAFWFNDLFLPLFVDTHTLPLHFTGVVKIDIFNVIRNAVAEWMTKKYNLNFFLNISENRCFVWSLFLKFETTSHPYRMIMRTL